MKTVWSEMRKGPKC